jgi:hypothetical protein
LARLIVVIVAVALTAACGGGGLGQAPRPLPEPTGEARTEDLPDGQVRAWPRSATVEEGVRYRMTVYTHCGLDYLLDFDGSFWEVASGPAYDDTLGDPDDEGIITLVGVDDAVYESSGGGEFPLRRVEGPREVWLCD